MLIRSMTLRDSIRRGEQAASRQRICRSKRTHELWIEHRRCKPSGWHLRWPHVSGPKDAPTAFLGGGNAAAAFITVAPNSGPYARAVVRHFQERMWAVPA
jgi:hypothetical protein